MQLRSWCDTSRRWRALAVQGMINRWQHESSLGSQTPAHNTNVLLSSVFSHMYSPEASTNT